MSDLQIRVRTGFRSLSEARPALERALETGKLMIDAEWKEDELHLSGLGARACITCVGGELIGQAQLRPPASFFASTIEHRFELVLREVANGKARREPEQ